MITLELKEKKLTAELNFYMVDRIRDETGIDLLDDDSEKLSRTLMDIRQVAEVIRVIFEDQLAAIEISSVDDFRKIMTMDTMVKARDDFYKEMERFFTMAGRPEILELIRKFQETFQVAAARVRETDIPRLFENSSGVPQA